MLIQCVHVVLLVIQTACCFLGELRCLDKSCKAHAVQISGLSCLLSRHQVSGAAASCAMGGGAVSGAVTARYLPQWELQGAFGFWVLPPPPKI